MYVRKIPSNLLWLRVGMGATTLFPSKGIESAGPLEIQNDHISLRVIYDAKNKKEAACLLENVKAELSNVFRMKIDEVNRRNCRRRYS